MVSFKAATATRVVHMRITYFAHGTSAGGDDSARVSLMDVVAAFQQLELLMKYAALLQDPAPIGREIDPDPGSAGMPETALGTGSEQSAVSIPRPVVLWMLSERMRGPERESLRRQALDAAMQDRDLAWILELLLADLSPDDLDQVLEVAANLRDANDRGRLLELLAIRLSGPQLTDAMGLAREIPNEYVRSRVFRVLAPRLGDQQLVAAVDAAREIHIAAERAPVDWNARTAISGGGARPPDAGGI